MAAEEFKTFLEAVDHPAASEQLINDAQAWFTAASIVSSSVLEGLTVADLESLTGDTGLPTDLPTRAFIRRACAAASVVATIKKRKMVEQTAGSSASGSGAAASGSSLGGAAGLPSSALALIASAAASSGSSCDINKLCSDGGIPGWPAHLHAEKALWDALDSASKKAAAETVPRKTFTFVDLTGKETLPVWLPQAVLTAGRSHDPSALGFDSSPQEVRLLMTALCAAATAPRAFTSLDSGMPPGGGMPLSPCAPGNSLGGRRPSTRR